MLPDTDESAIQTDAYIDALLAGHARLPVPLPVGPLAPPRDVRHVIRLLEQGLPRFHPSFLFEERLVEQLRAVAGDPNADGSNAGEPNASGVVVIDRRLLFGGAIASGFSLAGAAAMLAWRRRRD